MNIAMPFDPCAQCGHPRIAHRGTDAPRCDRRTYRQAPNGRGKLDVITIRCVCPGFTE